MLWDEGMAASVKQEVLEKCLSCARLSMWLWDSILQMTETHFHREGENSGTYHLELAQDAHTSA